MLNRKKVFSQVKCLRYIMFAIVTESQFRNFLLFILFLLVNISFVKKKKKNTIIFNSYVYVFNSDTFMLSVHEDFWETMFYHRYASIIT